VRTGHRRVRGAIALGLGTGAVFKLVPQWFPSDVSPVTGVVGAAGGLGGFFPPLLMAIVKSLSGSYTLGFILLAIVAAICLLVIARIDRATPPATVKLGSRRSGTAVTPG
jgi:nitrate/nitrite transporter NarK